MVLTRRARLMVFVAMATAATVSTVMWGAGKATGAVPVPVAAVAAMPVPAHRSVAPEADISYHGHVSLWGEGLGVWLLSENHGPSDVMRSTVRLRFSVALTGRQEMPGACLQSDARTVLCRTGPLRAGGAAGRQFALELQLTGRPNEVVVRIDTAWDGGVTDRNPQNDRHEVLAPATGDEYVF
ncbi:hypothetical protein ACFUNF_32655 [Streptomyces sp. NPDC057291]|uniref:hypothetical protein n=1 Tax=Streptomyces sp. NPDC057291 TaxID=3346087 RepID=UPI00364178CE